MKLTKIAGALLAVLVLTGSAAALPAAAGAQATDNANDDTSNARADAKMNGAAANASDESDADSDERPAAAKQAGPDRRGPPADAAGERGPPASLPEQVPDFVGEIHTTVQQHIDGTLDGDLGAKISGLTPDDEGSSEQSTSDASESSDTEPATETNESAQ